MYIFFFVQKMKVNKHMTRSLSVPVNVKVTNLRPTDARCLVRVISARPHPTTTDGISTHSDSMQDIGKSSNLMYFILDMPFKSS